MITLYHFTAPFYLPSILSEQRLRTTFSELDFPRAGEPRVVWLTDDPRKDSRRERHPSSPNEVGLDKMGVRFAVRLSRVEATRWKWFARQHGATPEAMARLHYASARTSGSWYVIEREIPSEQWCGVTDTGTGAGIPEGSWPEITRLLPELQEIQSHTYLAVNNTRLMPVRMVGRLLRLSDEVMRLARSA
jgi:hypothetical protein